MNALIIFCAQYLVWFVVGGTVVAWLWSAKEQRLQFAATVVLSGVIAYILAHIASRFYYDPRPFVAQHIQPLIAHAADNGFPSDHALFTMTLTVATYFFHKKAAGVMFVLAVAVGIARILAHVHSPVDIAAGWLIGALGAVLAYYAVTALRAKMTQVD